MGGWRLCVLPVCASEASTCGFPALPGQMDLSLLQVNVKEIYPVTLIGVIVLVQGVYNDCTSLQSSKPSNFSGIVDDIVTE